ncbi:hypothetical protein XU18_0952 [Perkinsela sp. CCAP 1560/4]|nr:hypothetical protein XU18_4696 [Perkinsela sp. CCAP 1560/4]KNH08549.1 hypothetical protein XU18_0952 [Perkinsela sp. CCAP 1560/4]|eukprot:KNH04026.1 hypothetical protein XU18_4696 [Perkinsela sp. CCAP 1560/4]
MCISTQARQYIRWIVTTKSQQEAKDLISAAILHKTWRDRHTLYAVNTSLVRSDWERALTVATTCFGEGFEVQPAVYDRLLYALIGRGNPEVAWEVVFRQVDKHNTLISPDSIRALEALTIKNPDRRQRLREYTHRNESRMKDPSEPQ